MMGRSMLRPQGLEGLQATLEKPLNTRNDSHMEQARTYEVDDTPFASGGMQHAYFCKVTTGCFLEPGE